MGLFHTWNSQWRVEIEYLTWIQLQNKKSMGSDTVSFFQNVGLYNVEYLKLKALKVVQTFLPKASLYL